MRLGDNLDADTHNFGKRVHRVGHFYIKPRQVFFEWLILSNNSPLRKSLVETFGSHLFDVIPYTVFEFDGPNTQINFKVEHIDLHPDVETLSKEECCQIGAVLGLVSMLGITDLHRSNVLFGRTKNGRLAVAPIDIECFLDDLLLPNQTLLLPGTGLTFQDCGFRDLLDPRKISLSLEQIAGLITGYVETSLKLQNLWKNIFSFIFTDALNNDLLHKRMIFRPTQVYSDMLKGTLNENELTTPLTEAERVQLERNDIPYFFRRFSSLEVCWYDSPSTTEIVKLPDDLTAKEMRFNRVCVNGELSFKNRTTLLQAGALQIIKYLSVAHHLFGRSQYKQLTVEVDKNYLGFQVEGRPGLGARTVTGL